MSNQYYIELGLRNMEGLLSDEENKILQEWIQTDPQNEAMLHDILGAYNSFEPSINPDSVAAYKELRAKIMGKRSEKKEAPKIRTLRHSWVVAAGILLLIGTIGVFYILQSQSDATYHYKALAQSLKVTLPEGSLVTLAPESELEYRDAKEGRICHLKGTALFDVSSTGSAFEVIAGDLNVQVLGTIFEVSQAAATVTVSVIEGEVQVTSTTDQEVLVRGDHIELQNGHLSKKTAVRQAIGQWHRQSMNFDNIDLSAGLDSLAQYYPVTFRLLNDDLAKCPLRGTLGLGSIEGMIETLKTMLDATINEEDDGIFEIDGPGCANE